MRHGEWFFAAVILFCCWINCLADVAPEPGYKRVYLSLVLESQGNVSAYRFFAESGGQLEEIKLASDSSVTIEPKGGGARYNASTVYAVPFKSVKFGIAPSADELADLDAAIRADRVDGVVKLLDHQFSLDVPNSEADSYTNPVYQIRIDELGHIGAIKAEDVWIALNDSPSKAMPTERKASTAGGTTILAVTVFVIAAALGGIWLLLRKKG